MLTFIAVELLGLVLQDPAEVKSGGGLRLMIKVSQKNGEDIIVPLFFWERQAELASTYVKAGASVLVWGTPHFKGGAMDYIHGDKFKLLESGSDQAPAVNVSRKPEPVPVPVRVDATRASAEEAARF